MQEKELIPDRLQTPEVIAAEKLESYFIKLRNDSQKIVDMRFSTEEKAQLGLQSFGSRFFETINEIEGAGNLTTTFFGPGVHAPNIVTQYVEDGQSGNRGVFVGLDGTNPLTELDPFEEVSGTVVSMSGQVSEREGGGYQAKPSLIVSLSRSIQAPIDVNVGMVQSMIFVEAKQRGLVELNSGMNFSIDALEKYRRTVQDQNFVESFKQLEFSRGKISRYLGKLAGALHTEKPSTLIELKKTRIIHEIGQIGANFARKGNDEAEIISRVILNRIGYKRQLLVEHEVVNDDEISTKSVNGHLVEVLMPSSPDDDREPALVIDGSEASDSAPSVHFIPFKQVSRVSF